MKSAALARVIAVGGAPPAGLLLVTLASYACLIVAALQGWPLWAAALAALLPWAPVFGLATGRLARCDAWLALFLVLAVTQGGHVLEHVAQIVQLHLLGLRGAAARGVFGALDIEWVHFLWNSWVLVVVLVLLIPFRANRWLWLAALLAGWHELEHLSIMAVFLETGTAGTPGLLARGGAIGGGLGLLRPDLHFLYNLVETTPLLIAFAVELRRALPHRPMNAPAG